MQSPKSESLRLKFTSSEWERINQVVAFSGKDRMNMCCQMVMKGVEELERRQAGGVTHGSGRPPEPTPSPSSSASVLRPLSEVEQPIFERYQQGMSAQQIARDLDWPLVMVEAKLQDLFS